MLIPSFSVDGDYFASSLSRRVNANSQPLEYEYTDVNKLIKKGEC